MKLSLVTILAVVTTTLAFAPIPSPQRSSPVVMNAEQSRQAFLSAAGLAVIGSLVAPSVAQAMDQEYVSTPTEKWETGKPTAVAAEARKARFSNARNQMNSNFPPIKRLTLERKSPVGTFPYSLFWFIVIFQSQSDSFSQLFRPSSTCILTYIHTYIHTYLMNVPQSAWTSMHPTSPHTRSLTQGFSSRWRMLTTQEYLFNLRWLKTYKLGDLEVRGHEALRCKPWNKCVANVRD